MEVRKYGNHKLLIADENKLIRSVDDVYIPEDKNENGEIASEHKPYYSSVIYLADNFDLSKIENLYVEERR